MKDIRVVELFAGVGGFRLGLKNSSENFKTIWANQWEPGKKVQHAYDCYVSHFGESDNHVNENIADVKADIPEHDLLVGGFPCQDYSVASTKAKGLQGIKGVLWWEIHEILKTKQPSYLLLENVDRLLRSPASQRGRDFAIMLRSLNDLGYMVEWRVINAAEYGYAQRRRRVFIFATHKKTQFYNTIEKKLHSNNRYEVLTKTGFFASEFKVEPEHHEKRHDIIDISKKKYKDLSVVSDEFTDWFWNSGIAHKGEVTTTQTTPIECEPTPLREIVEEDITDEKYVLGNDLSKWEYLKGSKKIPRRDKNGFEYTYSEGGMAFPDSLDLPGRTMLTSESSVNRSTHVIEDPVNGNIRLITPIEAERLNGFKDNWTDTGMPHRMRYFTMGNALVVPLITRMGNKILEIEKERK